MYRLPNSRTPLHMAVVGDHIEVVKFLTLETHCEPTSRDEDNDTALHLAVMNGHLGLSSILHLSSEL